jgi:hypothetical protein
MSKLPDFEAPKRTPLLDRNRRALLCLGTWLAVACASKGADPQGGPSAAVSANTDPNAPDKTPDKTVTNAQPSRLKLLSPVAGSKLQGNQDVLWQAADDIRARELRSSLDDETLVTHRSTAPFSLDTLALADGKHTLTITVVTEEGESLTDSVAFSVDNPDQRLESITSNQDVYAAGETVVIDLVYSGPSVTVTADFKDVDGATTLENASSAEAGHFRISHRLGAVAQATKQVLIHAKNSAGESVDSAIPLQVRALPRIPIDVANAYFMDSDEVPFEIVDPSQSVIPTITGSPALLTGVPTTLGLSWNDSTGAKPDRIIVKVEGYAGYYVVPVAAGQSAANIEISLPQYKPGDDPGKLRVLAGIVGLFPKIAFSAMDLHPYAVQSGGVQFTLRWDKPADLDLIVETPDSKIID